MAQEEYTGTCPSNVNFSEHFVSLIKKNNCENIQLFLANLERNLFSNNLFRMDGSPTNALIYAMDSGFYNSVLCLINTGNANINQKNRDGYTPLMMVCGQDEEKSFEVAQALINHGCNLAEVNNDGRTALIRCCRYRTTPSLRIGIVLLDDVNHGDYQFILDNDRLSGLDYLLTFDEDGIFNLPAEEYCQIPEYVEFVVRYLKLYFDKVDKADQVYERNIEKICRTKILYDTFGPALRRAKTGINLYDVCKPLKDAGVSVPATGVLVPGLQPPEELEEASEIPLALALPEEGVSPGGRWVSREQARQYVRLYPPGKGPNDGPGGGPAGGKKRNTIKKNKKSKLNKKTRRQRR